MPIYEYKCTNCDYISDYLSKSLTGGPKEIQCKICGCVAKKILSTVSHAKKKKGRP